MIYCDKCKTENEDFSDYCEHCGDKLVPKTLCCPDCGLYNKVTAKFCNSCGINLLTGAAKEWVIDNRYSIQSVIKSGAMGAVYRALDRRLGVKVAVKKLFNNGGNADDIKKSQEMFRREAEILASLHHSCLPKVNDYFSAPDETGRNSNFLVMSLIEGEDLETYLGRNRPPLPLDKVLDYTAKIIDILEYLHTQTPPVIYRDLKPSNIMLCNGSIYLVDFGIAKALESSKTGTAIGTAGYASPDQCKGNDHLSNDIYSLGVLTHYLLTGINPEAKTTNLFTFEPIRNINPQVPEHIDTLIASMVEMRISDRPGSVGEVRMRLKHSKSAQSNLKTSKNIPVGITGKTISQDDFFKAIRKGDKTTTTAGLTQGININMKDKQDNIPLHIAVNEGNRDMVEYLISMGADVNKKNKQGETPLHLAAKEGRLSIAEILLQKGATVNAMRNDGMLPLNLAVIKRKIKTGELLRKHGGKTQVSKPQPPHQLSLFEVSTNNSLLTNVQPSVKQAVTKMTDADFFRAIKKGDMGKVKQAYCQGLKINQTNKYGVTPLHEAVCFDNTEIVRFLIEKGANINAKTIYGATPLHWSATNGKKENLEILILQGAIIDSKDTDGMTPLHRATKKLYKAVIEVLLKKGAFINTFDNFGNTPLHYAVLNGGEDIIEVLIASGSNINALNNEYRTPLRIAESKGNTKIVHLLRKHGKKDDSKKPYQLKSQSSPISPQISKEEFFEAIQGGDINTVKKALNQGNNNFVKLVYDGWTPLHWVSWTNQGEIAALLISKGADISAKDSAGRTPMDVAKSLGYIEIVLILRESEKNETNKELSQPQPSVVSPKIGIEELFFAVKMSDIEKVKQVLECGIDVNTKYYDDMTAIHWAAWSRQKNIAELLVSKGANINAKDKDGWTPLHRAASNNSKVTAEFLISKGADVNSTNIEGWTPLHLAAFNNAHETAELLMLKGAVVGLKDKSGKTPLMVADSSGNMQISKLLRKIEEQETISKIIQPQPSVVIPKISKQEFFEALKNWNIEIVRKAITEGMNVNTKCPEGWSPLHWAAYYNSKEIVELLILKGSDINAKDKDGWTPLYRAAFHKRADMVEFLIAKGADISEITDKKTSVPQPKSDHISNSIEETEFFEAVKKGDTEAIIIALDQGMDINLRNKYDWTPLHWAAHNNSKKTADLLISKGAAINIQNNGGRTPLHIAALQNYRDMVGFLISKGADVNIKDNKGRTPNDLTKESRHGNIDALVPKKKSFWDIFFG